MVFSMRIFDRYLGRQLITATFIAVAVLSIVMVLGNVLKRLLGLPPEVLRDMPGAMLARFIGYAMAASLPFTVPWALLTAVLLVFGRLSADNELLAMRMAGRSFFRLCAPVFALALTLSGLCFWINLHLAPLAQTEIVRLPTLVAAANPKALLAEDQIIDQIDDFIIYIGKKKGDDRLEDFQMLMLNEDREPASYMMARRARLTEAENGLELTLDDGIYIARDEEKEGDKESGPENVFRIRPPIPFGKVSQSIVLRGLQDKLERIKPRMMGTNALRERLSDVEARRGLPSEEEPAGEKKKKKDEPDWQAEASGLRTEISRRFSFSLACFVFAVIGVPLGVTAQRRETSIGFALSFAIGISYVSLLMLGDSILKDEAKYYPWLVVWLPNVLFLGLGGWLFWRLQRR